MKRDEQSSHQAGHGSFREPLREVNISRGFSNPEVIPYCVPIIYFYFLLIYLFLFFCSNNFLFSLLLHLPPLDNHSFLPPCIPSWFLDNNVTISWVHRDCMSKRCNSNFNNREINWSLISSLGCWYSFWTFCYSCWRQHQFQHTSVQNTLLLIKLFSYLLWSNLGNH